MSALAPTMQAFFTERLQDQRQASPNTIAAYRDTFRLLITFAEQQLGKTPSQLHVDDLDASLITSFLDHLQHERGNSTSTRNARLAAIRSLFTTPHSGIPSTPTRSHGSWQSRPNAARRPSSRTSPTRRSTRFWPPPTATAGPADATTRYC